MLSNLHHYWRKYKVILIFVLFFAGIAVSVIQMIVLPAHRTGPFGIGLPAPMKTFDGKNTKFTIKYPESWNAAEIPHSGPGKKELIASILVPGRSFPHIFIYEKVFNQGTINDVAVWGKSLQEDKSNYQEISISLVQSSNDTGLLREYTWEDSTVFNSFKIRCYDWYTLKGDKGFAVTLCSEEADWSRVMDVFQQAIQSFHGE